MIVRLALAQWLIGEPADFDAFATRVQAAIERHAAAGVHIVVWPEYLSLELAAMFEAEVRGDFVRSLAALQAYHPAYVDLFATEARRHGLYLLAGTFLHAQPDGRYRNRALLFTPDGDCLWQDKLTLTGFERQAGVIEPGDELCVFDTAFGRLAVNVCYDSEFPLYARAQCEAGARLILLPSCTDTPAGATRVRVGGMARALENQVYVAQAVTAGVAPWSPALDINTGIAAVYAPSDRGLPPDGLVACAAHDSEWLVTDIDLDLLVRVREHGQVANAADWGRQLRPDVARARVLRG